MSAQTEEGGGGEGKEGERERERERKERVGLGIKTEEGKVRNSTVVSIVCISNSFCRDVIRSLLLQVLRLTSN